MGFYRFARASGSKTFFKVEWDPKVNFFYAKINGQILISFLISVYADPQNLTAGKCVFMFLTEEIQYHDGLQSRELGQAPILLCGPNS